MLLELAQDGSLGVDLIHELGAQLLVTLLLSTYKHAMAWLY